MASVVHRVDRRAFLTCLGASVAGIAMLGCASPPPTGKIGQRVERGGAALQVKEVVRRTVFSRYNATTRAQSDQTFILVTMIVQNVSAPQFETAPSAFTLTTAEGRIFKPLSVGFHMPEPSHTPLAPGGSSHEPAVFEIPPPADLPTEPEA